MMQEEEARRLLREYKERTGMTQTAIAKEMGISDTQLSTFLKGSYKAPHTVIPKVEELIQLNDRKEIAPKEPGFQRTTVSGIVMDLIAYCHIQGKIGVVYGDAGIGKTMGIREYVRTHPDTAVMITCTLRQMALHTIGLNSPNIGRRLYTRHRKKYYKPFRNYFYGKQEELDALVDVGYMNVCDECYRFNREGLDWLGEQLGIVIRDEEK